MSKDEFHQKVMKPAVMKLFQLLRSIVYGKEPTAIEQGFERISQDFVQNERHCSQFVIFIRTFKQLQSLECKFTIILMRN